MEWGVGCALCRAVPSSRARLAAGAPIGFLRTPGSGATAPREVGNALRVSAPAESSRSCEMFLRHEERRVLTVFFPIILAAVFFRQWVVTHSSRT